MFQVLSFKIFIVGKKKITKQPKDKIIEDINKIEKGISKELRLKIVREKRGNIYIYTSHNNIITTLTDINGNTLYWISAGKLGFKGKRKATPYAASKVVTILCQVAKKIGINQVDTFVNGVGSGRKSAMKTLGEQEIDLLSLKDVTPIPHNGCMPPKPKRN